MRAFRIWLRDAGGGRPTERRLYFFRRVRSRSKAPGARFWSCAGQLTLGEIIQKLEQQFMLAPKEKIRADVIGFLEQLHAKRIVDY